LQYLHNLEVDLADAEGDDEGWLGTVMHLEADKNDSISCELGIRYPTLQSILSGFRKEESPIHTGLTCYVACYISCY
jgi:hypothetical protein